MFDFSSISISTAMSDKSFVEPLCQNWSLTLNSNGFDFPGFDNFAFDNFEFHDFELQFSMGSRFQNHWLAPRSTQPSIPLRLIK